MFGGSAFLNSMGSAHGGTMADRTLRPYQNFEAPWGKGPYYDEAMMLRQEGRARDFDREFAERAVRKRVTDAKAAGLHPLFAMGIAGSSPTAIGGAPRGSRPPISRGSGGAPSIALRSSSQEKRLQEEHELNMERGHIENLKASSELALLEQQLKARPTEYWPDDGYGSGGAAAKTIPYGQGPSNEMRRRPIQMEPNVSIPLRAEMIADDGWRYRVLSPDAGRYEVGQADLVYQAIMRMTRKARLALPREYKIWIGRWRAKRDRTTKRNMQIRRER